MRKLSIFNFTTLNGFYKGPNEEINWHVHGEEENQFSIENLKSGNILLFGRITYEVMVGYWTTPMAHQSFPIVAKAMDEADKIVFSRTLQKAEWSNTRLIKENMIEEIKKMKRTPGKNITVLGSGNIITQLADHNLIDEYLFMIDPVILGEGATIFEGLKNKLDLKLTETRTFKSGVVLLSYQAI